MPDTFFGTRVEAIPGTPLPYGLLSVATLPEIDDPHELNGIAWQPISCAAVGLTDWCAEDVEQKAFGGSDVVTAEPVAVYHGYECNPVGQTEQEAADYARAGLAIGEQKALEQWLAAELSSSATNITPGAGPVGPDQALGLLEGALADVYGGVGVVHVPATASAWVSGGGRLYRDGARFRTTLGNMVSLGAGYQLGSAAAPSGAAWLYATGPVIARRAAEVQVSPATVDTTTNVRTVLAERVWVVGYECAAFAVQVHPCDCDAPQGE